MMKILIIEDSREYGQMLETFLRDISSSIVVVKTWKEAAPHLKGLPDAAIIDLQLGDLEPIQTVAKIQDLRASDPEIVIIVLSGVIDGHIAKLLDRISVDSVNEKSISGSRQKLYSMIIMSLTKAIGRGARGRVEGRLAALMKKAVEVAEQSFPQPKTI